MSKMRNLLVAFIFLGALSTIAFAQDHWTPFTAKIANTTDNVDASGKHSVIHQQGVRMRSSDGKKLEYTFSEGTSQICCGALSIPVEGVTYQLDYLAKRAIGRKAPSGHRKFPKMDVLGYESIAGRTAVGYPVLDPTTNKQNGEIWFDRSDPDLILRVKMSLPYGGSYVSEITDIQYDVEPNAAQLQIPGDWEVAKPQ